MIILTILLFLFLKFYVDFPVADTQVVGAVLTIASVLFGLLAGFFISELWSRYTEIRELQGIRTSEGLNMVRYANYFYKNKKFKEEFIKRVEKSSVADEVIAWDEGHFETEYYQDIEGAFRYLKNSEVRTPKDEVYFDNLLDAYHKFVETTVRMDTLYKERLFFSEWLMMVLLSVIIALSVLFLEVSDLFYQLVILLFPAIIVLGVLIINDLNFLTWSRGRLTLEPNQLIFDAIGVKRFYRNDNKPFISPHVKEYRTEEDLTGNSKKVFLGILKKRKVEKGK